ncbi:cytochrome c oxidase assembly factor 4 homolog, mitochondrial [Contarinia nasturtii]|uniref:cytochrome c oxidase assembly factor 4 homolog, mitochondrial n=1 Tax=Contarinia nasturtii TaxID=265458 RepID=UPI0012D47941|nr:cytochrome c oxidase assembly factor 4 homolog, mitochondrial [Contarinia nasturtii]
MTDAQTNNQVNAEDLEDKVDLMLQKTGCQDLHYKVQECIAETQDWRKCQEVVKEFRNCMSGYMEEQRNKYLTK